MAYQIKASTQLARDIIASYESGLSSKEATKKIGCSEETYINRIEKYLLKTELKGKTIIPTAPEKEQTLTFNADSDKKILLSREVSKAMLDAYENNEDAESVAERLNISVEHYKEKCAWFFTEDRKLTGHPALKTEGFTNILSSLGYSTRDDLKIYETCRGGKTVEVGGHMTHLFSGHTKGGKLVSYRRSQKDSHLCVRQDVAKMYTLEKEAIARGEGESALFDIIDDDSYGPTSPGRCISEENFFLLCAPISGAIITAGICGTRNKKRNKWLEYTYGTKLPREQDHRNFITKHAESAGFNANITSCIPLGSRLLRFNVILTSKISYKERLERLKALAANYKPVYPRPIRDAEQILTERHAKQLIAA